MAKFLKYFILGFFCVFLLASSADAQDSESLMTTIYGGLADVVEANMNSPSRCIVAVENFCQGHKAEIDRLSAIAQGSRQQAMQQDYSPEDIDERKVQQAFEAMAQSKGFQAMNRFMQVMQNFCMQNPDYAQELGDAIEKAFPQPREDY